MDVSTTAFRTNCKGKQNKQLNFLPGATDFLRGYYNLLFIIYPKNEKGAEPLPVLRLEKHK
jgi:hypothetical protein